MLKSRSRLLSLMLSLVLIAALFTVAAAETEIVTTKDYEKIDDEKHLVIVEQWEYYVGEDGELTSGHPVEGGDGTYEESHTFKGGACVYCYAEDPDFTADSQVFVTCHGAELSVGMAAGEAVIALMGVMPADAELSVLGVDDEVSAQIIDLFSQLFENAVTEAEFIAQFSELITTCPEQTVDGVACYIVELAYTYADGSVVSEKLAFDQSDLTLVSVF